MKTSRSILLLLLLLASVFTLATTLQPRTLEWTKRSHAQSALELVFGDGRKMFANHFFVKADVAFHSGYYPTIFDQARTEEEKENAMAQEQRGEAHEYHHDENGREHEEGGFLGKPTDWIDAFGRRFRVTEHTHLEAKNVREILPWLKISAELDPQQVETYTVAAYWLRTRLGKIDEAEQFLRQGLRANPNSYEILFELGQLYREDRHDPKRARGIWELAYRRWQEQEPQEKEPDYRSFNQITENLAALEREQGNYQKAIEWFELAKTHSPNPGFVQKQIDDLKQKLAGK